MRRLTNQKVLAQCRQQMEIRPFRVACGEFIGQRDAEWEELVGLNFALVPPGFRWTEGIYAVWLDGDSMWPRIVDKTWGIIHPKGADEEGRIVLVEEQNPSGERYTLKKFHRRDDGDVELLSLNRGHPPIPLTRDGSYQIRGWFVGSVSKIERVEQPHYPFAEYDETAPEVD
ncbi:MAG: S24 family peptidase [Bryobacteraceae bacterium]